MKQRKDGMFTNPIGQIIIVSILISLLILTSCASNYQTIKPRPDGLQSHIKKGDHRKDFDKKW